MTAKAAPRRLELLAPARDAATARAAVNHGADAVYIGAPAFGARSAAVNSLDDIASVVEYAHRFGVKVYVTLNVILYENELESARRMVWDLWRIGVDALIVQDAALLEMDLPPIDLHASTQWNTDEPQKAAALAAAGFSQIVVAREFSLEQIAQAAQAAGDAAIEVFVHGALCVSHSGGCYAGQALAGRSANRGECPQVCRLRFVLEDGEGRAVENLPDGGSVERYWLSMADMNRLDSLAALIDAGASSFKIEGRLKPVAYVKNVTAAYSRELDRIVSESDGALIRSSFGSVHYNFTPDTQRSFNRGFTHYLLTPADRTHLHSWQSPKWIGLPVARVVSADRGRIKVDATAEINNGDGLGWFDAAGMFKGFRVNKAENGILYPAPGSDVPSACGTQLYRNSDVRFETLMARDDTSRRTIAVDMSLRLTDSHRVVLDINDERGCSVSVATDEVYTDASRTPQIDRRRDTLARLGDTIYGLRNLADTLGDTFMPASALTALRRRGIELLDRTWLMRYHRVQRRRSTLASDAFAGRELGYEANVANSLARKFYTEHGAGSVADAFEMKQPSGRVQVMTTDYCLRRELGVCLKTQRGKLLPADLYLCAPMGRLQLCLDCENCMMKIYTTH